jgi:hypothetical protein
MDPDRLQEISERDQLWASLRGLRPEIECLAADQWDGSDRQQQLVVILSRIVLAELDFRAQDSATS